LIKLKKESEILTGTVLDRLRNGLIVSCQASPGSPLANRGLMSYMAEAAEAGGAAAIRAEGLRDITDMKKAVSIPIIGLIKLKNENTPVVITPLLENIYELLEAGVDLIAVDATLRKRLNGTIGNEFVAQAKAIGAQVLADIDDLASAIEAEKSGALAVCTTLAGYTKGPEPTSPDIDLVKSCSSHCSVPVIAEGRFNTPELVQQAFAAGAWSVCVGSAITDPWHSTKRFIKFSQGK
jgi:N-acylglucosamine-6-phosphate 2-epimerase